MIKQLINMPMLNLNSIAHTNNTFWNNASIRTKHSRCPDCAKFSKKIHDHYIRTISDLPVFQYSSIILLKTRKFKCVNPRCKRKVFSEQISAILKYSRRTNRVSMILESFAIECTGKLGSIISKQLCIAVSCSTLTRIAHSQQLPKIKQPKVLGVDDWAYRKGVSYGTILIDMETSKPIDILPSRESKDLKKWLMKYNDVQIVTRDRSSSYSSAIDEACPNAVQVADRFHLLTNLSDALDTYFKSISGTISRLVKVKTSELLNLSEIEPKINITTKAQVNGIRIDPRLDRFNKVKELQSKGVPIKRISIDLGMSRNTVRSYFVQESLSPRSCAKYTNIELFTSHIVTRLNTAGHKKKDIIKEIRELGFNGGNTQAYYNINIIRDNFKISTPGFAQLQKEKIPYVKPISSRKLAKYIGSCLADIADSDERYYLQTLLDNLPELRIVRKLVKIFKTMMIRGRGNIKRWIDFVLRSKHKLAGLKKFARGLLRDIDAVENGIRMSWSNGAVEGHVNRIKSIKRQMYGRASFNLLRQKVILSQTG